MRPLVLNRAQRVVIVIGLGALFSTIPALVEDHSPNDGWVAYSPLSPARGGDWPHFLLWALLIIVWAVISVALLRDQSR